jgi:hypothetical protein
MHIEEYEKIVNNFNEDISVYLEPNFVKAKKTGNYGCLFKSETIHVDLTFIRHKRSINLSVHQMWENRRVGYSTQTFPIAEIYNLIKKIKITINKDKLENLYN